MKMNVTINGQEHYTSGSYVFDYDATIMHVNKHQSKQKKEIIQKVSLSFVCKNYKTMCGETN